jgi:hypothetical protein
VVGGSEAAVIPDAYPDRTFPVPPPPIRPSRPIYDWLAGIKADMEKELDRRVTFNEVLEWLRAQVTP